jgi:hypothetical protein
MLVTQQSNRVFEKRGRRWQTLGDNCDGAVVVGVVGGGKGDYAAAAKNVKKQNKKKWLL